MLSPVLLTLAINCSLVSTTLAINCSPVSTTLPINFSLAKTCTVLMSEAYSFCKTVNCVTRTRTLPLEASDVSRALRLPFSSNQNSNIFGRWSQPWPPKFSLEPPWQGAKAPHTPWSEAPETPKTMSNHNAILYLVLAVSEVVWVVYGCIFSRRFHWHHLRLCPTLTDGNIADLSPSTFSYPR